MEGETWGRGLIVIETTLVRGAPSRTDNGLCLHVSLWCDCAITLASLLAREKEVTIVHAQYNEKVPSQNDSWVSRGHPLASRDHHLDLDRSQNKAP